MPCSDGGPTREQVENQNLRLNVGDLKIQNDMLANLICRLCTVLEDKGQGRVIKEAPLVGDWWEAHKKFDAERKRIEDETKVKENALSKLSAAEKSALGIN